MLCVEAIVQTKSCGVFVDDIACLQLNSVEEIRSGPYRDRARGAKCRNERDCSSVAVNTSRSKRRAANPRSQTRDCFDRINAAAQPVAFIREKEEGFVSLDRTAHRATKLIQP